MICCICSSVQCCPWQSGLTLANISGLGQREQSDEPSFATVDYRNPYTVRMLQYNHFDSGEFCYDPSRIWALTSRWVTYCQVIYIDYLWDCRVVIFGTRRTVYRLTNCGGVHTQHPLIRFQHCKQHDEDERERDGTGTSTLLRHFIASTSGLCIHDDDDDVLRCRKIQTRKAASHGRNITKVSSMYLTVVGLSVRRTSFRLGLESCVICTGTAVSRRVPFQT